MRWLDAVRYADTAGFHGDNPIPAWPYRDYVLQAFRTTGRSTSSRENKSPETCCQTRPSNSASRRPTTASIARRPKAGFNPRNTWRSTAPTACGRSAPCGWAARSDAPSATTTSSIRFSAKDFYAMKAFFADIQETGLVPDRGARAWGATLALPTEAQRLEIARLETKIATARSHLDEASAMRVVEEQAREADLRGRWQAGDLAWTWQHPIAARALGGATLTIYDKEPVVSNFYLDGSLNTDTRPGDGLVVASGANPDRETYVVTLKPGAGTWHQLGLDVVQDERLPGARYARGADRFLLSEVEAEIVENDQPARRVAFTMATVNDTPPAVSSINDPSMPPLAAIDGNLKTAWGIRFGEARNPFLALRFADAVHTTDNTTIVVTLRHESELRRAVIGRFRLALAADAFAWPPTADAGRRLRSRDPSGRTTWASGLPEDVMRALRRPPEDRDAVEATARARVSDLFESGGRRSAIERCSCWRPSAVCSTRRFLGW